MENEQNTPVSNKTKYIIIAIVVLAILGWFLSRGTSSVMLAPDGVDVNKNLDGSATYSNDKGSVTVGGNSLPENWPSDAPKYSNAVIQYSASSNAQTGEVGSAIVFMTSDSAKTVVDFYKKELASNGWKVEQTATIGAMTVLVSKKDTRTFSVQIADAGNGQTTVTIGISLK